LHVGKLFNNCLNSLLESRASQVLIEQFHLRLLAVRRQPYRCHFYQRLPQYDRYRERESGFGDPNAVPEIENLNSFGEHRRDNDRHFGLCRPLVGADFR